MNTIGIEDPNLVVLTKIAEALGDVRRSLVFTGGCAAGLLITTAQAQRIRATLDVDAIAQVASLADYHAIEEALRSSGFTHDTSENAPICRWIRQGVKLDLMPSQPLLAFHNRWYPLAVETAQVTTLPSGIELRLVTAPAFIATKLEAFKDRGNGDYLASHDLEDVVTIIDGRSELLSEVHAAPTELREYLATEFRTLLGCADFVDSLSGHLSGDSASQARLPLLLERMQALSQTAAARSKNSN